MASAMEHLTSHKVRILKKAETAESSEVVVSFLGCEGPEKGYDKAFWKSVETVAFLEDPDGHLIEIIPY
jgi:lactoylglutathione lyase